uniref:Uncharacterized protein LOC100185888 n=1 Tax=Phallusia mammillata TaxID=59560 RepID=A0A6F9DJ77_9ASCI|nr:uncharacterized protein LOC100185888 [Phallusia mammillata]
MHRQSGNLYTSHQKEYISVKVENPIINNTHEDGRFTTYEVTLQTNSPSFAVKHSTVERRYSDFVWLRRALARTTDVKPPSLPIGRIFGLFTSSFLEERQKVLTEFMRQVVQETLFLSNTALHLFLQTNLKRPQMDAILKDAKRRGSMDCISRAVALYGAVRPTKPIKLSTSTASLSDSGEYRDGASPLLLSRSAPNFHNRSSPRSFGTLRHIAETERDDSCMSSSVGSSQPRNNNHGDKDEDWVVLEPENDVSVDDVTSDAIPCDRIDKDAFTKVTWQVGNTPKSSPEKPTWNEFRMSKFLSSNSSSPVREREVLKSRGLEFRARSFDSMLGGDVKRRLRDTLAREGAVHRSSSDNDIIAKRCQQKTKATEKVFDSSPLSDKTLDKSDVPIKQESPIEPIEKSKNEQEICQCEKEQLVSEQNSEDLNKEAFNNKNNTKITDTDSTFVKQSSPPIPIRKPFLSIRSHSADDCLQASRKNPKCSEEIRRSMPSSLSSTTSCEQAITSSIDSGVGGSDDDRVSGKFSIPALKKSRIPLLVTVPK